MWYTDVVLVRVLEGVIEMAPRLPWTLFLDFARTSQGRLLPDPTSTVDL